MKNKTYLVLLIDRKMAKLFTFFNGKLSYLNEFTGDSVPQKVKHGDNTWDAQDKIFRHIENHLDRYLTQVSSFVSNYVKQNPIDGIILGSHKPLFAKIKKHLPFSLLKKVKGEFVTELKGPVDEVSKKAALAIARV